MSPHGTAGHFELQEHLHIVGGGGGGARGRRRSGLRRTRRHGRDTGSDLRKQRPRRDRLGRVARAEPEEEEEDGWMMDNDDDDDDDDDDDADGRE